MSLTSTPTNTPHCSALSWAPPTDPPPVEPTSTPSCLRVSALDNMPAGLPTHKPTSDLPTGTPASPWDPDLRRDVPATLTEDARPPAKPPPPCPPGSLFDQFLRPISPRTVAVNLRADQELDLVLATMPTWPPSWTASFTWSTSLASAAYTATSTLWYGSSMSPVLRMGWLMADPMSASWGSSASS